ncbi:Zn-dependent hydrolase [Candidimonas nitroreducens]|uniref:Zn-dependent hydrolase n=1 Tax=Candidimonas nitroreducens TaxID=683354 RepID=A0A225M320_9BURK|nr:Zn-dependent hydrolase [Candidimonas nitroreducens]OWT55708.1 Zn-dependent hydrolase [Candidimonas nitroreducens]
MVDENRLFDRLTRLGDVGRTSHGGVSRLALTDLDRRGLELIARWMREAGLQVRMDAAGNLIGRKEGRRPDLPVVLTGSHSDTTQEGGMFDGALGILGGIEALQCMNERGLATDHPIEVCAYRDEEGCRFAASYSGSRIMTGKHDPDRLSRTDENGISIAQALQAQGIEPERVGEAARVPGSVKAHVELHIEQGKVLASKGLPVGIVTGICASSRSRIVLTGEAMHAGTTPMSLRRDPMAAAAVIIQAIEDEARRTQSTVATVGMIRTFPGGVNVIPSKVEFSLDCRDIDVRVRDAVLDRIVERAKEICEERTIGFDITIFGRGESKLCSDMVKEPIRRAFQRLNLEAFSLPSGAGHDSGAYYDFCPMGMIFVRSKDGISHNPAEWSSPEDCARGAQVLYHTLLDLAAAGEDGVDPQAAAPDRKTLLSS